MARRSRARAALLVAALAALAGGVHARTYANQTQVLLDFKAQMLKRGPHWAGALAVSAAAPPGGGGGWSLGGRSLPVSLPPPPRRPQSWNCPTAGSSNADGSCDPCGNASSWWGSDSWGFDHGALPLRHSKACSC